MEEYKVLITTSGLGSRLGEITDYTNKSLVRVADKPSISYIIESYPKGTKFVISLGHFGDQVKQFLELAYDDYDFTFVEVDKYKGDGSSLGYSIYQCKDKLQCPFIFHASDTIINDYVVIPPYFNYSISSNKEDSSQYRTVLCKQDELLKINEKGALGYDFSYIGVCGVNDYQLFFDYLEKLLNDNFPDISDVHVINCMLKDCKFKSTTIESKNWFDVGNVTELNRTKKSFHSNIEVLDKKDESIFFFDEFIIKFFYNKEICQNRVSRALKLNGLVPEILDHTENFYKYKKAEGDLLSKCVKRNTFIQLLNWTKNNLWELKNCDNFSDLCYDFYITKTKKRISEYLKNNTDSLIINGCEVGDIWSLIENIDTEWLSKGIPCQFHGDFILDNIIKTNSDFCLIDWRQDFAGRLDVGDIYYDLAKMNHNLVVNHDIVNKSLFSFDSDDTYILTNSTLIECKNILHKFIIDNGYDLDKVELLTSIIWINMSPLHEYPFNNFLFNFGKYNLYQILNKQLK